VIGCRTDGIVCVCKYIYHVFSYAAPDIQAVRCCVTKHADTTTTHLILMRSLHFNT